MNSLAPISLAVKTLTPLTASQAYRRHLSSACQPCAGGHFCSIRERLDYLAAREASRGY